MGGRSGAHPPPLVILLSFACQARSGRQHKLIRSFQLAGRVLLIFLFIGFIFQGKWSIARVFVSIIGLGACVMVAVGFKAKWSASFLVALLSVFNIFVNNWSSLHRYVKSRTGICRSYVPLTSMPRPAFASLSTRADFQRPPQP